MSSITSNLVELWNTLALHNIVFLIQCESKVWMHPVMFLMDTDRTMTFRIPF